MPDKNILHLSIAPPREVGRDLRKNSPWLFGVAISLIIYILLSALIASELEKWTYLHAAYFTVINTTTVGFGDVTPATHPGKLLAGMNALVGLIAFGFFVSALTMALQPGSYTGTIDLPRPEVEVPVPDKEHFQGTETSIHDFLRGLGGLFTTVANQPHEGGNNQDRSARVRIRVHHHDPQYVSIDIHIDLQH